MRDRSTKNKGDGNVPSPLFFVSLFFVSSTQAAKERSAEEEPHLPSQGSGHTVTSGTHTQLRARFESTWDWRHPPPVFHAASVHEHRRCVYPPNSHSPRRYGAIGRV